MRETHADTRTALLQALGLHGLLFALMFAGLNWTRSHMAEAAQGDVIEADLVDPSALSAAMRSALQRSPERLPTPVVEPRPEPLPEPVAEPPVEALPPPEPDPAPVEQEQVQRDAESPEVAKEPREQEEKRKQPTQAELDAQKREQQLAEIRKQREKAARERTQAEMRAQQLADARASALRSSVRLPGTPEGDAAKLAAYGVAITDAVERQWIRPDSVRSGQRCQVLIVQVTGGDVVEVQVSPNCPFDELGRRSLEAAVRKASPLPYAGFEQEFQRRLVLWFEPSE
jgi:colicin import membrane protein